MNDYSISELQMLNTVYTANQKYGEDEYEARQKISAAYNILKSTGRKNKNFSLELLKRLFTQLTDNDDGDELNEIKCERKKLEMGQLLENVEKISPEKFLFEFLFLSPETIDNSIVGNLIYYRLSGRYIRDLDDREFWELCECYNELKNWMIVLQDPPHRIEDEDKINDIVIEMEYCEEVLRDMLENL